MSASASGLPRLVLVRFCFVLVVLGCLAVDGARAQGAAEAASGLVRRLGDETLAVLDDTSAPKTEQIAKMRSVFRRYFAVEDIGQFVLSRYWRRATPEQRTEYLNLFEDLIVYGYARRFGGYAGERLEIYGTRGEQDGTTVVRSRVVSPNGASHISIDWLVESAASGSRITDVVVEGVSLKLTQRSDFTAAIKQQGGDVGSLIELLRDKTKTLKQQVEG